MRPRRPRNKKPDQPSGFSFPEPAGPESNTGGKRAPASRKACSAAEQSGATQATLSTQSGTPLRFARLFVKLSAAHLLLDATPLHQLAETANRFLNAFPLPNCQLDHETPSENNDRPRPHRGGRVMWIATLTHHRCAPPSSAEPHSIRVLGPAVHRGCSQPARLLLARYSLAADSSFFAEIAEPSRCSTPIPPGSAVR